MPSAEPVAAFFALLKQAQTESIFVGLTLGKPRGGDSRLRQVLVRPIVLKAGPHWAFTWRETARDTVKNLPPAAGVAEVQRLLGNQFGSAHLFTATRTHQLEFNKKGEPRLSHGVAQKTAADTAHDRTKSRLLPESSHTWMEALGLVTADGAVRPGQADKHRQIHHFVELLSHLAMDASLPESRSLEIADMGCGKGYLTFATHDYFSAVLGKAVSVRGVEQRIDLVEKCASIARRTGRGDTLVFQNGSIRDADLPPPDVLIALHACDTATDDALARGLAAGAALLVVAPCCQHELRPQLRPPSVLAPALRQGIFVERHAEFVTDALRVLLLEWAGYTTKAFEFISTEHTAKNLMIAATRRTDGALKTDTAAQAVRELAAFYGVRTHALARHLNFALTP